jgi:DUF438 domain-containing protein
MKGEISEEMVKVLLEALPIEFSVLNDKDKVVAWNKHETRVFKRPESVIGKDVRNCHPKNSLHKVEQILDEMKQGKRDTARFWIDLPIGDKESQKILIEYYALRDAHGTYMGCMEASLNITNIQQLTGEKRLLD